MAIPTLTVRQPWASLIIAGFKIIENRSWPPPAKYMGKRIAIHAGGMLELEALDQPWVKPYIAKLPNPMPRGAVIGTVMIDKGTIPPGDLVNLGKRDRGDPLLEWWTPDHHGWMLCDPRAFSEPVRAQGNMGIWMWEPPEGFCDEFLPEHE
ncbi:MAG: ASCH domain-containing protein [Candidatus Alcyoniella australis]|nr:ASCH domain-containing protein [Candidatus Alcyoniella australis]